jgi:hypothetical protein
VRINMVAHEANPTQLAGLHVDKLKEGILGI